MDQRPELVPISLSAVTRAAGLLRSGRVVALPAETVYVAAVDASDDAALEALFTAKNRPRHSPITVLVSDVGAAEQLAMMDGTAHRLAESFWPGPLTMVLPRRPGAPLSALANPGLDTIAVRVPAHPVTRAVLNAFKQPMAVGSANRSGTLTPTTPHHVAESLEDRVALILAGGRSTIGIETSLLDLATDRPRLLRPGPISIELLQRVAGPIEVAPLSDPQEGRRRTRLPVRLDAGRVADTEALLAFGPDRFLLGGAHRLNLSEAGDLHEAAANLYVMLRTLDEGRYTAISVMAIPREDMGLALTHRLRRIAGYGATGDYDETGT